MRALTARPFLLLFLLIFIAATVFASVPDPEYNEVYPQKEAAALLARLKPPAEGVYAVSRTGSFDFDRDGHKERFYFINLLEESTVAEVDGFGPRIIGKGVWLLVMKGGPKSGKLLYQFLSDGDMPELSIMDRPGPLSDASLQTLDTMKEIMEKGGNPGTAEFFSTFDYKDLTGDGKEELILSQTSMGANTGWEVITVFKNEYGRWRRILGPLASMWEAGYEDLNGDGAVEIIACPGHFFHRLYIGNRFDWANIYAFRDGSYVAANNLFPRMYPLKYTGYIDEGRAYEASGKGSAWGVFPWEADLREAQIFDYNGKYEPAAKWYRNALKGLKEENERIANQFQEDKFLTDCKKLSVQIEGRIHEIEAGAKGTPVFW